MSRKRREKKTLKAAAAQLQQLDALWKAERHADFLRLAAEVGDLAEHGLTERYRQAFQHIAWRHLRGADLRSLATLLATAPDNVETLPVFDLAKAVLLLDAGDLEGARSRLDKVEVACDDGHFQVPAMLLPELRLLCGDGSKTQTPSPTSQDLVKISSAFERLMSGEIQRLPSNIRLHAPLAKHLWSFLRQLIAVDDARLRQAKHRQGLRRTALDLANALPDDSPSAQPLRLAADLLQRLELSPLEASGLTSSSAGTASVDQAISALESHRQGTQSFLGDAPMTALAPLRHALLRYYRSWLQKLEEVSGPPALSRARATGGEALGHLFDIEIDTLPEPFADLDEYLRASHEIHSLMLVEGSGLLAKQLHQLSAQVSDPVRRLRLWGLELCFLSQAEEEKEDFLEGLLEDLEDEAPQTNRFANRWWQTLRSILRQVESTLPDPTQRQQVISVLREEVLKRFDHADNEDSLGAIERLLIFRPDDPVLLLLGAVSAAFTNHHHRLDQIAKTILARGAGTEAETEDLLFHLEFPLGGEARDFAKLIETIEPLFGRFAPQVRNRAADSLEFRCVTLAPMFMANPVSETDDFSDLRLGPLFACSRFIKQELEPFRPILGSTLGFRACQVLVVGGLAQRSSLDEEVQRLFEEHPELEMALSCNRLIDVMADFPGMQDVLAKSRELTLRTLLSRLDGRIRLWGPSVKIILHLLDRSQLRLVEDHLARLDLGSPRENEHRFAQEDRRTYELLSRALHEELEERSRSRPVRRSLTHRGRPKKPRRSAKKSQKPEPDQEPQQLGLFNFDSPESSS